MEESDSSKGDIKNPGIVSIDLEDGIKKDLLSLSLSVESLMR